jgi:urease accessory protein UreE
MLHYEALQQLSHDRTQQRRREAEAERLALQARGQRQRRRSRLALTAGLDLLLRARRPAARHGAGA